jgi:hypothetical protein
MEIPGLIVNISFDICRHRSGPRLHVVPSINIDFMRLLVLNNIADCENETHTITPDAPLTNQNEKHIEII